MRLTIGHTASPVEQKKKYTVILKTNNVSCLQPELHLIYLRNSNLQTVK